MLRLNIGYYTFAFLDQYGNKKINEIKDEKDLKNVLDFVKNNFIIISQKNLNKEIKQLCEKFNVLFNENIEKQMVSNSDKLIINNDIIEKIKYKDRYLYELFKSFNFS